MLNFSFLLIGHAFQLEHFLHGSKYVFGDNVGLAQLGLEGQITVAMIDVDALGLGLIRIVDARADQDGNASLE